MIKISHFFILQGGTTIQGNPFLSQVGPLTPRSTATSTPTLTVTVAPPTSFSTANSAFTNALSSTAQLQMATIQPQQLQIQQLDDPQTQSIVATSVNAETKTVTIAPIVKPSPTKAG